MKFKLLVSLLIAAMLVCSFAFAASAAGEVTKIGTADELVALMADSTAWAGNYKLTADIDLTGKAQNPIGNSTTKFTGTFDGDNHEITGLSLTDFVKEAARNDGLYPYSVVENITDECVYDDGVITTEPTPEQDGVMTYTCECGRTKTEIISISCAAHEYIAKADGTYACANGCKNLPAPTAPVIVAATPAVATDGTVTVAVAVKATTPIVAAEFEVNAPAGFTLVSADLLISPADEDSVNWTAMPQDDVTVPYNVVLVNMAIEDATLDEVVIALTFATDETVENGTIITVNGKEACNLNEDMFEILSVSAEITVANKLDALYGISATLANELLLEYLVKLGSDVNVENGYITVAHYAEGTSIPTVEIVSEYTENSADEYNVYRFFAPGVAAKEMSDRIVVTFHATVDGKSYAAASYEKNIVDYYNMAYAAYGEATTGQAPAFMNALNALLNYGAVAQRYFGYNKDNPANSVLPADKQKTTFEAEASATTRVEDDVENDVYVEDAFYPILGERVVMAISFKLTGDAVNDLVFKGSYTDINGGEKVVTVSGDKIKANESGVVVYVDSVAAKDLRQMITGALYSGETQVSDSISFSFECYATVASSAEKNICNAILNYCDAAKALFAKSTVSE